MNKKIVTVFSVVCVSISLCAFDEDANQHRLKAARILQSITNHHPDAQKPQQACAKKLNQRRGKRDARLKNKERTRYTRKALYDVQQATIARKKNQ